MRKKTKGPLEKAPITCNILLAVITITCIVMIVFIRERMHGDLVPMEWGFLLFKGYFDNRRP